MNPYITSVGTFDYQGILQRLEGVWIAYSPTDDHVGGFMIGVGGGTFVSRHEWTPDLFHPCYWIFRQGNILYVFIAGTDIIGSLGAHVWGDVAGYFLASPVFAGTVNYHSYFADAAAAISATIATTVSQSPNDTVTRISVSGHSYGAAVAQIVAKTLQSQLTGQSVECLAFGSPKPGLITQSFTHPSETWSLGLPRDPAIYMPPSAGNSAWLGTDNPVYAFFGVEGSDWSHFGKAGEISGQGITQLFPVINAWRIPPANFVFADHGIRAYRDQLLVTRRLQLGLDGPDSFEDWILGSPQPPVPLDPGPPPSQRAQINPSVINSASFASPPLTTVLTNSNRSDTFSMSTVFNLNTGTQTDNIGVSSMPNLFKFTFFPGEAILGDSISQILQTTGSTSDADLDQAAQNWMGAFVTMLSNPNANQPNTEGAGYPLILGYRVSDVSTNNQARLVVGPFTGSSRPPVWTVAPNSQQSDYGSNAFNNGILLKLRSRYTVTVPSTIIYNRVTNFFVPSTPDPLVKSGKFTPAGVVSGGFNWVVYAESFGMYLSGTTDAWGHMGLDPSIPTRVATIAACPVDIWQFFCDDITGYAVGDMLQILTANARGWNGIYRIIGLTPAVGATPNIIQIATQKPKVFPPFTSASVRLYRKKGKPPSLVFWRYVRNASNTSGLFPPVKPATRKPARKFVPVSFRRRNRLPKTSR